MAEYCENCGAELRNDSKFCQECGSEVSQKQLEQEEFCPNCGESIAESENFCENCGLNLNTPQTVEKENLLDKYKIPIIIIVTAAIVVFTCVIALSMTAHNDSSSYNPDYGTQTVNVGNVQFEIPGDYRLEPTTIDYGYENYVSSYQQSYTNGEEEITLAVLYSPGSNVDANSIVQQTGGGVPKTIMGHDGYYGEFEDGYAFYFGIGNKVCMVAVSSPYVLDQINVLG